VPTPRPALRGRCLREIALSVGSLARGANYDPVSTRADVFHALPIACLTRYQQVVVLGSSGSAEEDQAQEASALGVNNTLAKPYNAETLLQAVAQTLKR
jgi:CheY-like chemotaxis protein